jgi:hypothetical protein
MRVKMKRRDHLGNPRRRWGIVRKWTFMKRTMRRARVLHPPDGTGWQDERFPWESMRCVRSAAAES